ncbi:hypothetical protein G9C85_15620 [Halorubellus sp. JP-L1]|uniref:hypothetical protein n=1 Tax=Halorubellus sp. JP-L1 TaxID=2715753 RepID=UPI00140C8A96|nr:hypothetical protein [Halorubellus sp. JP-L1]NHN43047.1 hypothetical protein [Halorubellus sp. JP-L1]
MGGVTLRDGELVVERPPNELDELAIAFSRTLSRLGIRHAFVAGYLAILTGRARATDDIDVFVEPLSADEVDELVAVLESEGYWGPAMPLDEMHGNLDAGTNIWVAPEGQMTPHLEVKFPVDEFDRASLDHAITAHVGDATIPVGPLELQIAYKLHLGAQKDFEDAAHLYVLFRESLRTTHLETWVEKLGVTDEYERLQSI